MTSEHRFPAKFLRCYKKYTGVAINLNFTQYLRQERKYLKQYEAVCHTWFRCCNLIGKGHENSVGIETRDGVDGPGIEVKTKKKRQNSG